VVVALLVWELVRYKRTGQDLKMLWEEIQWNRREREKVRAMHMREVNRKKRGR